MGGGGASTNASNMRAESTPLGSLTVASETGGAINSTTDARAADVSQSKMALLAFEADFNHRRGSSNVGIGYLETLGSQNGLMSRQTHNKSTADTQTYHLSNNRTIVQEMQKI